MNKAIELENGRLIKAEQDFLRTLPMGYQHVTKFVY